MERPDEIIPAVQRAVQITKSGKPALLEVVTREEPQALGVLVAHRLRVRSLNSGVHWPALVTDNPGHRR